uniref:VWFA domain-containing protein n=1 Tax=Trypanosoma congolense (strain IL3000) TaxID=1068625 RepID=G0ULS9_TRYCI|nr:conserved hypothetical protein [Trypanosoma congolense IL3000]
MLRGQALLISVTCVRLRERVGGPTSRTPARAYPSMSDRHLVSCNDLSLTIGDVTVPVPAEVSHPERVAWLLPGEANNLMTPLDDKNDDGELSLSVGTALFHLDDGITRKYLRWICQKELLRQDMCLVGEPGPALRWLVLLYSCITRRELQCVSLNRDSNENDLGQRREIRNGTLTYENQSVVVAALEGQLLLLEGLEKVERNVLPAVNNLLENREMHLENGMVLIHPERYDRILGEVLSEIQGVDGKGMGRADDGVLQEAHEKMKRMGFLRVSENFRVIGVTVPVPPYEGAPLDPPLRSRFQCLYVEVPLPTLRETDLTDRLPSVQRSTAFDSLLKLRTAIDEVNARTREFPHGGGHVSTAAGICSNSLCYRLQSVGSYEIAQILQQLLLFPDVPVGDILIRFFPWTLYAQQTVGGGTAHMREADDRRCEYERLLEACHIGTPSSNSPCHTGWARSGGKNDTVNYGTRQLTCKRGSDRSNDILSVSNIHVEETGGCVMPASTVVVGEACIDGSRAKYKLPVYLGQAALTVSVVKSSSGEKSRSVGVIDVRAHCQNSSSVLTAEHFNVLQSMLQLHIARKHILLLGPSGSGKTVMVHEFSRLLGYHTETMYLYADMTVKDLFQRRTTDPTEGDTTWENSSLVEAALKGYILVLDGVDKLPYGMLSSLQQLLIDGSATLHDGTTLKSLREYGIIKKKLSLTDEAMRARRIFPIHPAFRVVGTARIPVFSTSGGVSHKMDQNRWQMTREVTVLFGVVQMPAPTQPLLRAILSRVAEIELRSFQKENVVDMSSSKTETLTALTGDVDRLLQLQDELEKLRACEPKTPGLSLRQLLNLIRFRVRYPEDFLSDVESALLVPLMTALNAGKVRQVMRTCGFGDTDEYRGSRRKSQKPSVKHGQGTQGTRGGNVLKELTTNSGESAVVGRCLKSAVPRVFGLEGRPILRISREYTAKEQTMVPYVPNFHTNSVHESIVVWLAKQYAVGNNILLIGNQGVGKNKVVDVFLSRIGVPREYIQLHRDTTVGSLTINPAVEQGRIVWTDSPLVRAAQQGHCLVVDEIDKAPVEVVQVLKGLIEDHEMRLRDGRQIRGPRARTMPLDCAGGSSEGIINLHPEFRIIVLANPPGFPFHGNDFYRECGDLFASCVMCNPDAHSQLQVLKAYGPNLPEALMVSLIQVFQRLQSDFEQGHLTYPFSLRELIAVVKHMAAFPRDGIYEALNNVFNFDSQDENTLHIVRGVLRLYLDPLINAGGMRKLLPLRSGKPLPLRHASSPLHFPANSPVSSMLKADGLAMSLVARKLIEPGCGTLKDKCSVPVWHQIFDAVDFTAENPPSREYVGLTEWSTPMRLPFLRQGDKVICIAVEGGDDGVGQPNYIAVLFTRQGKLEGVKNDVSNASSATEVLLAVTAPPSISSLSVGNSGRHRLPAGHAQLFDLTAQLPLASVESSALHFIPVSEDTISVWGKPGGWSRAAFGAPDLLVAVVNTPEGLVVFASPTSFSLCSTSASLPHLKTKQQDNGRYQKQSASVTVMRVAPPVTEPSLCRCSVFPAGWLVAMSRPHSPQLYAWMKGHRIVVTFPADEIEGVHFFTENLASMCLKKSGVEFCGVMKLVVSDDGIPTASFCILPGDVSGTVVGFVKPGGVESTDNVVRLLAPEDLQGVVIVPRESSRSGGGDVVYMTVDSYSPQLQSWSVRTYSDADVAVAVRSGLTQRSTLGVDHVHNQLIITVSAEEVDHLGSTYAIDYKQNTVRRFAPLPPETTASIAAESSSGCFSVDELAGMALWYENGNQQLLVADVVAERVERRHHHLTSLLNGSAEQVGAVGTTPPQKLPMSYSKPRYAPSNNLKHGREDEEEHHGGNTFAGGTGGTDTAGLGGQIGPYRLDKGHPVHQVSPEAKDRVPKHIVDEAKRMGRAALEERLREIGMSAKEYEQYEALQRRVRAPVASLRSTLNGFKAVEGERRWLRGQTDGVWDDSKIVEGIVGERNIYKRRGKVTEVGPFQIRRKKRLLFVLDVSASMYRFEGTDRRLTKLLEAAIMVMESFTGFEEKIDYAMIGHNGDSACIELVPFGRPPANQKERMEVCQRMVAHAQYCWSGDNTVQAMKASIGLVTAEQGEAYLVFVVSDANLSRYGIEPRELSAIIRSSKEVQMFCIFIATLGEQALNLREELPKGHGFECMNTDTLPHILKQIFMSANIL